MRISSFQEVKSNGMVKFCGQLNVLCKVTKCKEGEDCGIRKSRRRNFFAFRTKKGKKSKIECPNRGKSSGFLLCGLLFIYLIWMISGCTVTLRTRWSTRMLHTVFDKVQSEAPSGKLLAGEEKGPYRSTFLCLSFT